MNKKIVKKLFGTMLAFTMLAYYTIPAFAYTNEEVVYTKTDVTGKNYKTIVSKIEEDKDGRKVEKIESLKNLPIEYTVTYKLDGNEISAQDIVGKKGRVTITLKFANKDEKQVNINGNNQTMYTPFLVVSGVVIDTESNKNIEVNHGKIINNGTKTIAAGFAIPGLIDSLDLEDSKIDDCDVIEISMDSEKFEIGNIMTFATPKLLSFLNLKASDFNNLFNQVTDLQNASKQIEDGSKSLNDGIILLDSGIDSLKEGSGKLDSGVGALKEGTSVLNDGAVTLRDGTSAYSENYKQFNSAVNQVSEGAQKLNENYSTLNTGINTLNSSSKDLDDGAKSISAGTKLVSSNLNTISAELGNASSGATSLNVGLAQAKGGIAQIVEGVKEQVDTANSSGTQNKIVQMGQLVTQNDNAYTNLIAINQALQSIDTSTMSETDKATINNQIDTNNAILTLLQENSSAISEAKTSMTSTASNISTLYGSLKELQNGIGSAADGASQLNSGLTQLNSGTSELAGKTQELAAGTDSLTAGTKGLMEGTASLAQGSNLVSDNLEKLSTGANGLSEASGQLNVASQTITAGANKLQNGSQSLLEGVNTLKTGTTTLTEGIDTLSIGSKALVDGSTQLRDGITKFNSEGINKIVNLVNTKGKNLLKRVEKLEELSENYNTFEDETKKREDIQFVSIMDSIGLDKDKEKDKDGKEN